MARPHRPRHEGLLMEYRAEDRPRVLALLFARTEGNIVALGRLTGYSRQQLYRLIDRWKLWPVVNAARLRRLTRTLAEQRSAA